MALPAHRLLIAILLPLAACARQPEPKPVERTQTNEQGCTRQRSVGPQDPFADPAPLKQACLGPHLLEIPQNYFYNQIGTEHDGSYALALEYPSLQPFKPGERMGLTTDVSIRTVTIDYRYIDRIELSEAMRRSYIPMDYKKDEPQENLETRIAGEKLYDLSPYFVDMDLVRAYYRSRGYNEDARVMSPDRHTDWYLKKDDAGKVQTVIKCTSREVTSSGVEYHDEKLIKSRGYGFAKCSHTFMIAPLSTLVLVDYPREGLDHWKEIEWRARDMLTKFNVEERKESH
ncbi:hypothetical protein [Stenotrophomonas sp. JAI102]|uniref:hypothetical protein n=1 Tax=Stenotrophomonas sp. JAI102 TaxID=2723077 RepID=UPI0015C9BEF2|nr:hypothetical protein [Stenotrophomonas sp. JAI102]NYF37121.1 hypothetical protein [Stenotrophomonas sp. JAI102]